MMNVCKWHYFKIGSEYFKYMLYGLIMLKIVLIEHLQGEAEKQRFEPGEVDLLVVLICKPLQAYVLLNEDQEFHNVIG